MRSLNWSTARPMKFCESQYGTDRTIGAISHTHTHDAGRVRPLPHHWIAASTSGSHPCLVGLGGAGSRDRRWSDESRYPTDTPQLAVTGSSSSLVLSSKISEIIGIESVWRLVWRASNEFKSHRYRQESPGVTLIDKDVGRVLSVKGPHLARSSRKPGINGSRAADDFFVQAVSGGGVNEFLRCRRLSPHEICPVMFQDPDGRHRLLIRGHRRHDGDQPASLYA